MWSNFEIINFNDITDELAIRFSCRKERNSGLRTPGDGLRPNFEHPDMKKKIESRISEFAEFHRFLCLTLNFSS